MRSILFVPGDSARKQEKCLETRADALILDLEDSVALSEKPKARSMTAAFLKRQVPNEARPLLYVRVNALDTGLTDDDLAAVMPGTPDGIMIPKAVGGRDMADICARLSHHEARNGIADGATKLLPVATETAAAVLALPTIPGSTSRMSGLTWGGEDLAADIGAEANHDGAGAYTETYVMARSMALLTAVASGVDPIETAFTNYRETEAFRTDCLRARRDGFTGRIAIHPNQVDIINEVFTPSPEAVKRARSIVEAFAANPGMGVVGIEGEMIDMPHLRQSERILRRYEAIIAMTSR
ncbi:MAG TPA: CoA ester lyase [Allosphingosinicella sp.]|nr:CoA ester lyase [Allosphingosinicella sp.]